MESHKKMWQKSKNMKARKMTPGFGLHSHGVGVMTTIRTGASFLIHARTVPIIPFAHVFLK